MLTAERARELLAYDAESGDLVWRVSRSNVKAGAKAGNRNKAIGYVQIGIDGRLHFAHRLAFLIQAGECPGHVDHINGDRADNRWSNLRPASKAQNNVNRPQCQANTSGRQGVHFCRATGRWRAVMSVDNRPKHLGRFDTIEAAAAAYAAAMVARHGSFVPAHVTAHGC